MGLLRLSALKSLSLAAKVKSVLAGLLLTSFLQHDSVAGLGRAVEPWKVAFFFALLSGLSLPIGALVGIWMTPVREDTDDEDDFVTEEEIQAAAMRQMIVGRCLAFGAGALLFAVTVELYGEAMRELEEDGYMHGSAEVVVMCAAAMCGALIYVHTNRWMESVLTETGEEELDDAGGPSIRRMSMAPDALAATVVVKRTKDGTVISSEAILRPQVKFRALSEEIALNSSSSSLQGDDRLRRSLTYGAVPSSPSSSRTLSMMTPRNYSGSMSGELVRKPMMMRMNSARALAACAALDGISKSKNRTKRIGFDMSPDQDLERLERTQSDRSAQSTPLPVSRGAMPSVHEESFSRQTSPEKADRQGTKDASPKASHEDEEARKKEHRALLTGMATWLGVFIDGLPEGVLLGFLAAEGKLSMALVISLFIANFPEAVSSAAMLREAKRPAWAIFSMWFFLFIITAVLAGVAAYTVPQGELPVHWRMTMAVVEGIAGGAMLACITAVMLPEAYHMEGDTTGLISVAGFLISVLIKVFGGVANELVATDGTVHAQHHAFWAKH